MTDWKHAPGRYASPPCLASEVAPNYFDLLAVDPEQARDVSRWRKAERLRLLDARKALGLDARRAAGQAIAGVLGRLIRDRFAVRSPALPVVSFYWPIKGEPDLRALMAELDAEGVTIALPIVEVKASPLVFRRWTPQTRMTIGDWNIPVPPSDAEVLTPIIAIAPLVGWDANGFRLGYGGGYFDRTLAALSPPPFKVGVGYQGSRLATIFPQPHDIPFNVIVTEAGVAAEQTDL